MATDASTVCLFLKNGPAVCDVSHLNLFRGRLHYTFAVEVADRQDCAANEVPRAMVTNYCLFHART